MDKIAEHTSFSVGDDYMYCSCLDGTTPESHNPENDETCCFLGDRKGRDAYMEMLRLKKEVEEMLRVDGHRLVFPRE